MTPHGRGRARSPRPGAAASRTPLPRSSRRSPRRPGSDPGRSSRPATSDPFFRSNLSAELTTVWGHSLSSGGSASFQALARWPEILTLRIASSMGASAPTAQRWFFTFIAVAAALGGVWFASAFARSPLARTAAGIVVVFNPFVLQHLPNPLTLWSIAMMGVAGGLVVRAARGATPSPWWLAGLSVFGAYLAINPPLLAMVAIWTVGIAASASWFVEPGASGRACRYLLRAAPWALLLNLWWVLPYGFALASQGTGYVVQAQTNVLAWSWTQVRLSPANVASLDGHWGWSFPEYFPYAQTIDDSIWAPLRFGLPALAFAAPGLAVRDRRRPAIVFAVAALLLLFLSKGLHAPLSGVNLFLYRQVPGMWLLREPLSKLGPMLVLLYGVMVALSLEGVHDLAGRSQGLARGALRTAVAVLAIGAVGFSYPMWTGQVVPDQRPILPSAHVQVPAGWLRLADTLNASTAQGKALVLPLDDFYQMPTTWGYYGVDNVPRHCSNARRSSSCRARTTATSPTYASAVRSVQTALLNGDGAAVPPLLRSLGVSYVIVRRDLDPDFPGRRFVSPDELISTLSAGAGLHRDATYGVADLFSFESGVERQDADPLIRAGSVVNLASTDPDDITYAVSSAPRGSTVVSGTADRTGSPTGAGTVSATVAGPTATTTTFSSASGDVRLIPRLVAPQLVHVGEQSGDRGMNLVLDRATTLSVDGRPVLGGTLANIHLSKGSRVAAVSSGAAFTPLVDGEALLGIGASGSLSAWAAAGGLTFHGGWTGVRDCHDYDGQSAQQSGLSATHLGGAPAGVALSARSHTACVSAQASGGASGAPLLLRFEYRTVDGRPARVCLWTDGPQRCAPIPPLDPSPGWHRYAAVVPAEERCRRSHVVPVRGRRCGERGHDPDGVPGDGARASRSGRHAIGRDLAAGSADAVGRTRRARARDEDPRSGVAVAAAVRRRGLPRVRPALHAGRGPERGAAARRAGAGGPAERHGALRMRELTGRRVRTGWELHVGSGLPDAPGPAGSRLCVAGRPGPMCADAGPRRIERLVSPAGRRDAGTGDRRPPAVRLRRRRGARRERHGRRVPRTPHRVGRTSGAHDPRRRRVVHGTSDDVDPASAPRRTRWRLAIVLAVRPVAR